MVEQTDQLQHPLLVVQHLILMLGQQELQQLQASSLAAGTYTVTVTDAKGCTDTETVTITQPAVLVAAIGTPTMVSCFGGNNGASYGPVQLEELRHIRMLGLEAVALLPQLLLEQLERIP